MAAYKESEDLINVGAYARGTNPKVDKSIVINTDMLNLLQQRVEDSSSIDDTFDKMVEIARKGETEIDPNFNGN